MFVLNIIMYNIYKINEVRVENCPLLSKSLLQRYKIEWLKT